MHIAIVGATGMLGRPVAHELIWAGHQVRIVARDLTKTKKFFPHVEVVPGDLRDKASLMNALWGVNAVYLNLSIKQTEKRTGFHTETEGLSNLIDVARQVGVRRIGYLSSIIMRYQGMNGFDWWVFRVKQEAVRMIKACGIPYSIFYPSNFMESLNGTQRLGRFVLLVGRSAVRPWYISAHDYGKQVVCALGRVQNENQEYVIQGPEAMTQHEAANRFVAAYTDEKLSVLTAPPLLMQLGRPFSAQANYGWHITEALNKYPEQFDAERTWAELGKPTTTMEVFARGVISGSHRFIVGK